MEKLFSLPASTLNKCEDDVGLVAKKVSVASLTHTTNFYKCSY